MKTLFLTHTKKITVRSLHIFGFFRSRGVKGQKHNIRRAVKFIINFGPLKNSQKKEEKNGEKMEKLRGRTIKSRGGVK